jgi:tRNA(Ile)-lysidine synthase
VNRVRSALERAGATQGPVVAAVSGGPDSTALLLALVELRTKQPFELVAAHVNHGLRGADSDADEQFVAELCVSLGLPHACRKLPVALDAAHRDQSIETTARDLRLQYFSEFAAQYHTAWVATAHTADDQAETVLHRIIRGTGVAGLSGIPFTRTLTTNVTVIRPLLEVTRAEVLEFLRNKGQTYREDHSNRDLVFTRNRLRHELIPYLAQHFNPQVGDALIRLARNAAEAQSVVEMQVERLRRRAHAECDGNTIRFDASALQNAPPFLVRELVRRLWTEMNWPLQELGNAALDRITEVATGKLKAWDLPGDVHVSRTSKRIVLVRNG